MKLAELGIAVDCMSLTPVKRSHSVCAQGGINSRQQPHAAAGRQRVAASGRHGLRRRLLAASAAGEGNGLLGAADHRPDGSPRRALQSHAGRFPRSAPFRRHALQADRLRRRDDRASSCSIRSMSRCAAGMRPGRSRCTRAGIFPAPVLDDTGRCRGAIAQNLITMEIRAFPADAVVVGERRLRIDLRPQHDVDGLQRAAR